MANAIMTTTLPTIIAMGTVSRTTETMFGQGNGQSGSKSRVSVKSSRRKSVVVGVAPTRARAEKMAVSKRKLLRKHGLSTAGIKVVKVPGGYMVAYSGK